MKPGYIPESITWSVNNKVTWSLYRVARQIDGQLDVKRPWTDTEQVIYTTDIQALNVRDNAILAQEQSLALGDSVVKVWWKDANLDFTQFNYALKMVARTDPFGENLDMARGFYRILNTQSNFGLQREQWVFLVKQS